MKVLHFIPTLSKYDGGPTQAMIGLCRALQKEMDLEIVTTDVGFDMAHKKLLFSRLPNVIIRTFPFVGSHTHLFSIPLIAWLNKNINRYNLLHIHALMHPLSTFVSRVAYYKKIPYIVRPLGTLSEYTLKHRNRFIKNLYLRVFERGTLEKATFIHFTTKKEADEANRLKYKAHFKIIPHPFEIEEETKRTSRRNNNTCPNLLFMSRLDPVKGLEILLSSLALLKKKLNIDFRLFIAGFGKSYYQERLKNLAESLEIQENVSFLGFVEGKKKIDLWKSSDIFILPSFHENFSMATVEAMSYNLPVIISDNVGLCDYIRTYNAGIVSRCNVQEIGQALMRLIKDDSLRLTLGKNGERLVKELFSPQLIRDQLIDMYERALRV